MAEKALTTVEDEQRLLERQRLRTERKALRKEARLSDISVMYDRVKETAARQVFLKRYVFLPDEDLKTKYKLNPQQIAIVRQWEQPKRHTAFAMESSSKLIEAETRAKGESKQANVNVQNMTVFIPAKSSEGLPTPIVIDVETKK